MRLNFLIVLFLFSSNTAFAQDYNVFSVAPALLKEVNAVKRNEQQTIQIIDAGSYLHTTEYTITVLNEKGDRYAVLNESYDKLHKIKDIAGTLYDASGKQIQKLKSKDIQDVSGLSDNNFMDDNRLKVFKFMTTSYPYTVSYTVVTKMEQGFYLPRWIPQEGEDMSVEKASFSVSYPDNLPVRHLTNEQVTQQPVKTTAGNATTLTWTVKNLATQKLEKYSKPMYTQNTAVYLAPVNFEMEKFTGDMSSWASFGKFYYQLNKDRDVLPDAVKQKVLQIAASGKTDREKVANLYKYLQSTTRYISVQLGIGGWQTFDAAYVAKQGYGDCKALTNYMHSMLQVAGIPSCIALIRAGSQVEPMVENFPSNQFNHVILCVPQQKDTIWLECTSQQDMPNYLGSFTGSRAVLLVTPAGGKVVKTPSLKAEENFMVTTASAVLQEDGNAEATVSIRSAGMQQDGLRYQIQNYSPQAFHKELQDRFHIGTYEIKHYKHEMQQEKLPVIAESFTVDIEKYASKAGSRLFVIPNMLSHSTLSFEAEDRKNEISIRTAFMDVDTISLKIPAGYVQEMMPAPVTMSTAFGSYSITSAFKDDVITTTRKLIINAGTYPASSAAELESFYQKIYKADRAKMVLVKK